MNLIWMLKIKALIYVDFNDTVRVDRGNNSKMILILEDQTINKCFSSMIPLQHNQDHPWHIHVVRFT